MAPPYQDSTGRNAGAGGPALAGFPPTYDFAEGAGLSGRAWVLDEPARLQPSVAMVATSRMSVPERIAMLNLFTSSPEAESPGTLPLDCQRPVTPGGDCGPGKGVSVRIVQWPVVVSTQGRWDCLVRRQDIRLKKASMPARDSVTSRAFASGSLGRHRRYWRRQQARREDRDCRIRDRTRPQRRQSRNRLPFRTRPRDSSRLRSTTSSEAAPSR